ncbi:PREDICTED: O-acyltransferase WSD1-like [Prunus mume]|uniref:O-acyltransferase WSD1-like n=2 Tax=Prunus mume TaxID=102107 RepID=A0ABM1LNF1_PRUMU|nr:PREDICTED: O-acyltransferase WSD1-like [Prunus mume]
MEVGNLEGLEPVSPNGQYFSSDVITLSVLAVLEFEIPIIDAESQTMSLLKNVFLPISPRFSSIMVENDGKKEWKRVEVKLEDHVNIPIFPSNLSPESYDQYLEDYLSKLSTERYPQGKPLWEVHIIKYPTSNAAGNVIFKFHHALGDGYSLMGALISTLQRADNPSLPLTFPSRQRSELKKRENFFVTKIFSSACNTISDIWWGISKTLKEDELTPIKSSNDAIEFRPSTIATMTFSLGQLKSIKNKLGVTLNDVLTGMIFFGTRLYMQEIDQSSSTADCTAMVLLNTRIMGDYMPIEEMIKPNSKMPWGNRFTFLQVPIPKLTELSNADDFIRNTHKMIKKKRNSLAVYFTSRLLEIVNKFGSHEASSRYIHRTLKNSSMVISNMIGPVEQMSLANHPIKGFYFLVPGLPQGFDITIVSYMGKVRLAFKMEKGIIDPHKLKSCMENAFDMIVKDSNKNPKLNN